MMGDYIDVPFRGFIFFSGRLNQCSGGLHAVQEGYIDVQGVICCSGVVFAFQDGHMQKKKLISMERCC